MNTIKAHKKRILTMLGMGMAMLFLIACSTQDPSPTGNAEASGSQPNTTVAPVSNSVSSSNGAANAERNTVSVMPGLVSHNGQMTGISVSGMGQATGTPDLATLTLGVEASRDTVQSARNDAAAAMERMVDVLKERGVLDRDIQTSFFSIHPRYDREGREITGFVVSNQVTARIRNLDRVGPIIDQVTQAGGDLTRFQGISFSIEDTKALEELARAAAVADMKAKADQLASLTGVTLGAPVSIVESGGLNPIHVAVAERAFLDQAASAPTPIMPGEVDVTVNIQAVYSIQ